MRWVRRNVAGSITLLPADKGTQTIQDETRTYVLVHGRVSRKYIRNNLPTRVLVGISVDFVVVLLRNE